ncbi:uncharacterized protein LOC6740043 [Drosophila simulans]|uniref:GD24776 n=1 Tax=Drosophila simulans TaxID=7240 RepID=B4NU74_DROSI|nr:uncharacterized protein LOC6740043 [Drosophila simulans]EDX16521.1 GD24776 [Drosophila simulans]KMZ08964.1 uncharacterized protein Dsimw501_GD24776 [Drosophila simulans]
MKYTTIILFALAAFVLPTFAANDYLWGEVGANDYKLAKDTVSKAFFVGLVQTKKYVFKQSDNLNALTITAIKITDKKKSHGATAVLVSGGPGSKGATIKFTSERGYGIKDTVEIWGR